MYTTATRTQTANNGQETAVSPLPSFAQPRFAPEQHRASAEVDTGRPSKPEASDAVRERAHGRGRQRFRKEKKIEKKRGNRLIQSKVLRIDLRFPPPVLVDVACASQVIQPYNDSPCEHVLALYPLSRCVAMGERTWQAMQAGRPVHLQRVLCTRPRPFCSPPEVHVIRRTSLRRRLA